MNQVKVKTLKQTRNFYNFELEKEGLIEKQRDEFLKAKKSLKESLRKKKNPEKKKRMNILVGVIKNE